ncbi:serine/threonine-protein kinase Nek3 isoform X1 [Acipenser ruthenus]|uniref:serine/threonine-protein kinase Nek3 isoform X1 n=1 Tax=Acipenser ruthenus TaxID=7906 RepID=UPI00145B08FE|nr:serine/threonine-protein kinase Nek3 isoform X1 [Acipenser ruthenus]XP_034778367.2 serine/threonine-protein kinase Nek3 isoform X1 [Acipenser ruthenus]XP_058887256.1 serine/threonine-protein kinase Nek3 isoform X1 [Acipenser ruthenus]
MDCYTVLKVIGEGSYGQALLVQPRKESEKYVLKEIRLPKTQSGIQSSRNEAILLAKMKHPNIVIFRESFEAEGHLYIVMEFCAGGDLMQKLKWQKGSLFPEDMILNWFTQICLGTKYIHEQRVLHRDLKSKNIFLTDKGTIKLGDFGSACILNSPEAYACTYVGTPYYVSPEIWDSKPYNNKSDVWSLGCVLYELCTLKHPFQANSWKNLILKICRGSYPPLPPHYSYELHYLIKQMFKINPKDRPSISNILTRHRVSKLIKKYLPLEVFNAVGSEKPERKPKNPNGKLKATKGSPSDPAHDTNTPIKVLNNNCINVPVFHNEEQVSKWKKGEGEKVARILSEKTLEETTSEMEVTPAGPHVIFPDASKGLPRKQWGEGPSNTVLHTLENAALISSGTLEPADNAGGDVVYCIGNSPRKQWVKESPEKLLNILQNANLSLAFKTYTIHKPDSHELLHGPLSHVGADDIDGDMEETVDSARLEPRSDDEDTDFEEESVFDWVAELEKMVDKSQHNN